ncbi:MAG: nucleotidyltransferase domain-containing protein [Geobacteraceae bacterium]|nr:nucleotidyltransferase domain-containing protein [Geobacteraceae bacterium]
MIDQALLDRATELLKESAHPKKIILFGSHARKEAREDSDVDILVIETVVKDRIALPWASFTPP